MIKRIIFDIDDTLLHFPDNFEIYYNAALNKHNVNISAEKLYKAIGVYETCGKYTYYSKEDLLKLLNSELCLDLNISFIDDFFEIYKTIDTKAEKDVVDTLEYLSKKYELVALSNWFTELQESRLQNAGILKYFKKVYGADIVPMKPLKESYKSVIGDLKEEECVMIGDSILSDIKVPYEMGFKVYYLTDSESIYPTIKKISDLKEIL